MRGLLVAMWCPPVGDAGDGSASGASVQVYRARSAIGGARHGNAREMRRAGLKGRQASIKGLRRPLIIPILTCYV